MNTAVIGKTMGWAQFLLNFLSQIVTAGLPHGLFGWLSTAGSLAMAIGVHAASSTDGAK